MKAMLIAPYYPPEIGGGAHLIYELALSLKDRGHDVTVVAGYPRYHIQTIPPQYSGSLRMNEVLGGISIRRIRIPSLPQNSKVGRGIEHFVTGLWLTALALLSGGADVAMTFSPPLPLAWMTCLLGKARRMPVVVNIQDLFPREVVELGMLTNSALIQVLEAIERQTYHLASGVIVHSPGNKEHVIDHGGDRDKAHVVYNWVDIDRVKPGNRDNVFRREHRLGDKFVVSYAGTMGWAQDMGTIIDSAARLRDRHDIVFLLVGEGVEKERWQTRSNELGLDNIVWLPLQAWSVYPEILMASDVSLINLHPELRTPVVPSKLLSIMAAARPVVATVPAESDARRIIAEADCGVCLDAGDGEALAKVIQELSSDGALACEMGKRGRAYVEEHFARDVSTKRVEAILKNAKGASR